MKRRIYSIGDTATPESAGVFNPTAGHQSLACLWQIASEDNRLWFAPRHEESEENTGDTSTADKKKTTFTSKPGSLFGLYALKHALIGTETEGMDIRFKHVCSLDECFADAGAEGEELSNSSASQRSNVTIRRASGSGKVQLVLLSNGVLVTRSTNPQFHGIAITLPEDSETGETPRIVDAAAGEGHFVCCDDAGCVYTFGWDNRYGQLGRGTFTDENEPAVAALTPVKLFGFGTSRKNLPGYEGGADDTEGTATTVNEGRATQQQQQQQPLDIGIAAPVLEAKENHRISSVNCGAHHSILTSSTGTCLFAFGRNHRGQLGITKPSTPNGSVIEMVPKPRSIPRIFGNIVQSVECPCDGHATLVVTKKGKLIVFGENTCGQFGLGNTKHALTPTEVKVGGGKQSEASAAADAPKKKKKREIPRYGTVESYLRPPRIKPVVNSDEDTDAEDEAAPAAPSNRFKIAKCETCLTHSVLRDATGRVMTSGLRPLRVVRSPDQPIDALGALGRPVENKQHSTTFHEVPSIECSTEDTVAAGTGFTCVLSKRLNTMFLMGSVSSQGKVLLGGGRSCATIDFGLNRRIVDVVAANSGGLLVVVDSPVA